MDDQKQIASAPENPKREGLDHPTNPRILQFYGQGQELLLIILQNLFFTLLTVGLYLPWAKTRMRRYIWTHTHFLGSPLSYEGTPWEILTGYFKLILIYIVLMGSNHLVSQYASDFLVPYSILMGLLISVLIYMAIYGSIRYLLHRTTWRGIRFKLEGSATEFGLRLMVNQMLTMLTLGLYSGAMVHDSWKYIFDHMSLGSSRFHFLGQKSQALKLSLIGLPLTILTAGLYVFWLSASFSNFIFNNVQIQGAQVRSRFTGGLYLKLFLLKTFGTLLSLGIAWPWIKASVLRLQFARMELEGHLDLAQTLQIPLSENKEDSLGDGLADASGEDFPGFDLGI